MKGGREWEGMKGGREGVGGNSLGTRLYVLEMCMDIGSHTVII